MQNPIQKFKQSSIVFEKPGILSENLKTLTSSNYPTVNIFCWNFAHVSYLPMSTKECVGFFLFYLDLEYLQNLKRPGFYALVFKIFINNSRSKQNNKNSAHPFVDTGK